MPIIFSENTGRVILVEDRVAAGSIQLGNVDAGGGKISYEAHNTIITRLGLSAAGNYQFLHTIGNDVYVYVFGDRMGQVVLHGLSFAEKCGTRSSSDFVGPAPAGARDHGFELLFKWYSTNRIAARKLPVRVTIGQRTNFDGFVTALSGDVQDTLHRTIQFQMTISLLPDAVV